MKVLLFTFYFSFCICYLQAQTISGIVIDNETAETIELVNIYNWNEQKRTFTTSQGKFSLDASLGDTLVFHYVGYDQLLLEINEDQVMVDVVITLEKGNQVLPEITIFADKMYLNEVEKPQRMKIQGLPTIENAKPKEPMSISWGNTNALDKYMLPVFGLNFTINDPITYFSKHEKEKRKLKKVLSLKSSEKIQILRDHKVQEEIALAFKLEPVEMNKQIDRFGEDQGKMIAKLTENEIVGQFILFLSERKE